MTAPAEDPRGGECRQSDWCGPGSHCLCPPAGDRAQPTQELHEAVARWCAWGYGGEEYAEQTGSNEHWRQVASELLALPELAALLDAQAAVNRVEAVAEEYRIFGMVLHDVKQAELFTDAAKELRRALDGP